MVRICMEDLPLSRESRGHVIGTTVLGDPDGAWLDPTWCLQRQRSAGERIWVDSRNSYSSLVDY